MVQTGERAKFLDKAWANFVISHAWQHQFHGSLAASGVMGHGEYYGHAPPPELWTDYPAVNIFASNRDASWDRVAHTQACLVLEQLNRSIVAGISGDPQGA